MAPPTEPTTVIVPFNLGAASKYEEDIFPLAYHKAGNAISKGSFLLTATLDEMIKIAEMGIDLNTDRRFRFNTRVQYEALAEEEAKLKNRPKTFNPFTMFRHYRAVRLFHAASKALFLDTKHTSERIQREERLMRAVPSTELHTMDNSPPRDATIAGFAIELPGALDADTRQKILAAANAIASHPNASDPFVDNLRVSQLSDADSIITLADTASLLSQDAPTVDPQETESTTSGPSSVNFNFYNSVLTTGSDVRGLTLIHGSGNTGSSMISGPPP